MALKSLDELLNTKSPWSSQPSEELAKYEQELHARLLILKAEAEKDGLVLYLDVPWETQKQGLDSISAPPWVEWPGQD